MSRGSNYHHRWNMNISIFWMWLICLSSSYVVKSQTLTTLYFTVEPTDITVKRGQTFTLNCSVNLVNADYSWTRNDVPISDSLKIVLPNGSLQITIPVAQETPDTTSGLYQCQATVDQDSIVSQIGNVQIASLTIVSGSVEDKEAQVGDTVILQCKVQSHPAPTITWMKDSTVIDPEVSDAFARFAILPSGNLEIQDVHNSDAGVFQCRAVNTMAGITRMSSDITLTVQGDVLPVLQRPSFIISPPENVFVNLGESIVLEVAVGEPATFTWFKKNEELILLFDNHYSLVGQGNLQIQNAEELDTGLYKVRASNYDGEYTEGNVQVTVRVPPRFVKRPQSSYAHQGTTAQFECSWYSVPRPTVKWLVDGEPIPQDNAFRVERNGEVGETLRIIGVKFSDSKYYQCIVSNEVGNINAVAQLIVLSPGPTPAPDAPVPGVPQSVVKTWVSTRQISLDWRSPRVSNGNILTYTVMIGEPGKDRPRIINTTAPALTSATIKDLLPDTDYEYSVCAWNSYGRGECTALATVRTQPELLPPSEPRNLDVVIISSTSSRLYWSPPEKLADTVLKYIIYFRPTESQSTPNIREVLNLDDLTYDLFGLRPNTDYTFYIRAENVHDEGPPSAEVTRTTFTDVPSEPPSGITIEPVSDREANSPSELMIFWMPPSPESVNGDITGYRLRYRKSQGSGNTNSVTVAVGITQHRLSDLDSETDYDIKITVININGTGPWSGWELGTTASSDVVEVEPDESRVPAEPSSLICYKYPNRIEVWWSPPLDTSIKVRGYIIGYGPNVPDVITETLGADRRHFVIENLEPASAYIIKLRAINNVGEGKPKYEIVNRHTESTNVPKLLESPLKVDAKAISHSQIRVTWMSQGNYIYTIRYKANFSSSRYKLINVSSVNECIVSNLKPFTTYIFDVMASDTQRSSEFSLIASAKTRDATPTSPPTDVQVIKDANSSSIVYLNWMPPAEPNGLITGYVVYFTTDRTLNKNKWEKQLIDGNEITTAIQGVSCNTRYYFTIQAKNRKGAGPYSSVISEVTSACGGGTVVYPVTTGAVFAKPSVHANVDEATIPSWLWFVIIGVGFLILFLAILLILCIACGCCACCADLCPCFVGCCKSWCSCWAACCPCCFGVQEQGMTKAMYSKPPHGGDGPDVVFNLRNKPLGEMIPLRSDTDIDSAFIGSETKGAFESAYTGMLINGGHFKTSKSGSVASDQATVSSDIHLRTGGGHTGTWSSTHGFQSESNLSQEDSNVNQPPTPHVSTHPLSSFSVPGPPPHYGTLPKSPPAQPRVKISAPSYSLLKRQQPSTNRNRSHPLPVVTPRAPDVTYRTVEATSPGSSTTRSFSTEDLNAEMLNLEGLMKDLNAITQSDLDC